MPGSQTPKECLGHLITSATKTCRGVISEAEGNFDRYRRMEMSCSPENNCSNGWGQRLSCSCFSSKCLLSRGPQELWSSCSPKMDGEVDPCSTRVGCGSHGNEFLISPFLREPAVRLLVAPSLQPLYFGDPLQYYC